MLPFPELVGGHVAIDLLNTVEWRGRPAPVDRLIDFAAVLVWCSRVGVLSAAPAAALTRWAQREPGRAVARHGAIVAGREDLHCIVHAVSQNRPPPAAAVAAFNRLLAALPPAGELDFSDGRFVWRGIPADHLESLLFRPAAELLAADGLRTIRLCQGPDCGWLFLDESRNRSRRWCSMRSCGNRAKARRHYRRSKG